MRNMLIVSPHLPYIMHSAEQRTEKKERQSKSSDSVGRKNLFCFQFRTQSCRMQSPPLPLNKYFCKGEVCLLSFVKYTIVCGFSFHSPPGEYGSRNAGLHLACITVVSPYFHISLCTSPNFCHR